MDSINFEIGGTNAGARSDREIRPVEVGQEKDLFCIAGPCVIESRQMCLKIARHLTQVSERTGIGIIFKASFDKANRSSISSFRGCELDEGLDILAEVREKTGLPVLTDVHEPTQAQTVGKVVDCLQVPAFLCRQTDLLCACAESGKPVNVKKGQFLSPGEMKNVCEKIRSKGNEKIMLTERGTFFGYNRLVNDMTAIAQMRKLGYPVVFDATHSTQQPGGLGDSSAGNRRMAPLLARAAVAAGADGLFVEVHPEPDQAKSDAACIMPLDWLEDLLNTCHSIFQLVQPNKYST